VGLGSGDHPFSLYTSEFTLGSNHSPAASMGRHSLSHPASWNTSNFISDSRSWILLLITSRTELCSLMLINPSPVIGADILYKSQINKLCVKHTVCCVFLISLTQVYSFCSPILQAPTWYPSSSTTRWSPRPFLPSCQVTGTETNSSAQRLIFFKPKRLQCHIRAGKRETIGFRWTMIKVNIPISLIYSFKLRFKKWQFHCL